MTVEQLKNDKSWGISDKSRTRVFIVYADGKDPTTLKYALTWFLGNRIDTRLHTTSTKSQYRAYQ